MQAKYASWFLSADLENLAQSDIPHPFLVSTLKNLTQQAVLEKRNDLTLKQKIEVLKPLEREPKIGSRMLAGIFYYGKTQIWSIIKNKEQIK